MLFDQTPAAQGFCPPGWHIPSENDWNILFSTYISNAFAGSPLKYSGFSGFNALLSGARSMNKGWDLFGFATFFWSSTSRSDSKAWAHGMNEVDPSVSSLSRPFGLMLTQYVVSRISWGFDKLNPRPLSLSKG